MNKASPFMQSLPAPDVPNVFHLTVIRDSTDANDALPFQLHVAKTLSSSTANHKILFLATRTRTHFIPQDTAHIFPVPSNAMTSATIAFATLDAYTVQRSDFSLSNMEMQAELTCKLVEAAQKNGTTVVVVECLHSLKMVFGVDPAAFVRSLLSPGLGLRVIVGCPTGCGIDEDTRSLADIADMVFDLSDLRTGVATDVDGIIRVAKEDKRWKPSNLGKRYFLTETSLKILS